MREIARNMRGGKIYTDKAFEQIREISASIPSEVDQGCVRYQLQVDRQALSTVLMSCFCLESYVNTFAYFLIKETDFLGLFKSGRESSAEVLLDAIDRLKPSRKWETIGKMGGTAGFDRSRKPFQDFTYLFKFRDDIVHDKVLPYDADLAASYNKKFPAHGSGFLDLGHALFAADVYWNMVQEIHSLTGVDPKTFHRHYNLMPWFDDEDRQSLHELAGRYRAICPMNG
jgi:hypothetical protein